jgi:hypothetical protein
VTGGLLPPYGEPAGTRVDDVAVLTAYVRGEPAAVWSPQFHIEGMTLVTGGDRALALRIGRRSFLVRVDLSDEFAAARQAFHDALASEGIGFLDGETLLAAPVAIQVLGSRTSLWDLWGADIDEAFADLRNAAAGEWDDLFPDGPPPVGGPPS